MVAKELVKTAQVGGRFTLGVLIVIVLGAAIGSLSREGLGLLWNSQVAGTFPWGTLVANLSGAFLLGLMATYIDQLIKHQLFRPFWEIGVIRSYTTLSTFSLEGIRLFEAEAWGVLGIYVLVSVFGGLFLIWLGDALGASMTRRSGRVVDLEERRRVEEEI